MSTRVSCDNCYSNMPSDTQATLIVTNPMNKNKVLGDVHYCVDCLTKLRNLYVSIPNPYYVEPPKEEKE